VRGGAKTHAPASQPQREWSWDELAVAPRLSSNPPRAPTRPPARLGPGGAFLIRSGRRSGSRVVGFTKLLIYLVGVAGFDPLVPNEGRYQQAPHSALRWRAPRRHHRARLTWRLAHVLPARALNSLEQLREYGGRSGRVMGSPADGGSWGRAPPRQPVAPAALATLDAQRSTIGMSPRYVPPIPAGSGSRPQLSKCPVILCSAIDRFSYLKKYHRPLILKGFLIAF
jgi:hypothetical protein